MGKIICHVSVQDTESKNKILIAVARAIHEQVDFLPDYTFLNFPSSASESNHIYPMLLRLLTTEVIEIQTNNPQDALLAQGIEQLQALLSLTCKIPPQVVLIQAIATPTRYNPNPWKRALDQKLEDEKIKSNEYANFQLSVMQIQNERTYIKAKASENTDLRQRRIAMRSASSSVVENDLPVYPTFLSAEEYIRQSEQLKASMHNDSLTNEQWDQYLAQNYYSMGCIYGKRGQSEEAFKIFQAGYDICEKYAMQNTECPHWSLAACMIRGKMKKYLPAEDALSSLSTIENTLLKLYSPNCFAIATTHVNWIIHLFEHNPKIQNAANLIENTFGLLEKCIDVNSLEMVMNISILSAAFLKLKLDNSKIFPHLLNAYKIYETHQDEEVHENTGMMWVHIMNVLGNCYLKRKEFTHALKYYFEAWDYCTRLLEKKIPGVQYTRITIGNNIALTYSSKNNYSQALDYYQRVQEAMIIYHYPPEHPNRLGLLINMAVCYFKRREPGDSNNAARLYEEILSNIQDPIYKAESLYSYSVVLFDLLKYEASKKYLIEALNISEERLPPDHPNTIQARKWLAFISARMNEEEKAVEWLLLKAYPIYMPKIIKAAAEVMIETLSPWRPSRPTLFRQHQPDFKQEPQRNSQQRL